MNQSSYMEIVKHIFNKTNLISYSKSILSNPNLTLSDIKFILNTYYSNKINLKWKYISSNPNITIQFVKDTLNKFKDWDWSLLSQNISLKAQDIYNNLYLKYLFLK